MGENRKRKKIGNSLQEGSKHILCKPWKGRIKSRGKHCINHESEGRRAEARRPIRLCSTWKKEIVYIIFLLSIFGR